MHRLAIQWPRYTFSENYKCAMYLHPTPHPHPNAVPAQVQLKEESMRPDLGALVTTPVFLCGSVLYLIVLFCEKTAVCVYALVYL